jgi:hypothetical protein
MVDEQNMDLITNKPTAKNRLELSKARLAASFNNLEAMIEQKIKVKNELQANYQEMRKCSLEMMQELESSITTIEEIIKV